MPNCEGCGNYIPSPGMCSSCFQSKVREMKSDKKLKISELKTMVKTIEKKTESAQSIRKSKPSSISNP